MTEILSCYTCKHCDIRCDLFVHCKKFPYETINYVTGDVYRNLPLCVLTREPGRECGPEGKGWEKAEQETGSPKKSILTKIRTFLDIFDF